MQGFPAAEMVQAGPRRHRPAVVQLPVQRARHTLCMPAPVLHSVANPLGLQDHAEIHERFEIPGHSEVIQHLAHYQGVAAGVFLVPFHYVGGYVPVGLRRVGADGLQRRQGLEAELAHEARELAAVGRKGLALVPHIRVVCVPLILSVRILERNIR